jgi:hypothetical protein
MQVFAGALALLVMAIAPAGAATVAEVARYAWSSRVLLVFAPDESDAALAVQREAIGQAAAGMQERDLVLLAATNPSSPDDQALRRRYGVTGNGFAALLIGKDGGVKLRRSQPIPPQLLFQTVDAMPMRQNEARRSSGRG